MADPTTGDLGLRLSLRIKTLAEAVAVTDAGGRDAALIYFATPERASVMKRVTREQAVEIAKVTARALTDAAGG